VISAAKDGTLRGNKPGNSAGAGRKKKPLADRIAEGRTGMTVLEFAEPVELVAGDVPPPKEYFRSPQKSGLGLCAEEIYDATYRWLHERGCENLVNPQQVETYSMTTARWIQCEEAISQYGFLSKHPTTQMPIASPFVAMAASFMKQSLMKSLVLPSEQNQIMIRFNLEGLLRGDQKSRYESYSIGIQNGFMSPNDVREIEDWNLIPEEMGGNNYYCNGNMITLTTATQRTRNDNIEEDTI
jgi:hypothetical protein